MKWESSLPVLISFCVGNFGLVEKEGIDQTGEGSGGVVVGIPGMISLLSTLY